MALDDAGHRRNHLSRVGLREADGRLRWFKIPVGASQGTPINSVSLPSDLRYLAKHLRGLEVSYGLVPEFEAVRHLLLHHLDPCRHGSLAVANLAIIQDLASLIGCRTPAVVKASSLGMKGDRNERAAGLLRETGATSLLIGDGGALEAHQFAAMDIPIERIPYGTQHPRYAQIHQGRGAAFMPGLSVVDCILNVGTEACRELVRAIPVEAVSSATVVPARSTA